jgi:hypothetical protein
MFDERFALSLSKFLAQLRTDLEFFGCPSTLRKQLIYAEDRLRDGLEYHQPYSIAWNMLQLFNEMSNSNEQRRTSHRLVLVYSRLCMMSLGKITVQQFNFDIGQLYDKILSEKEREAGRVSNYSVLDKL